MLEGKFLTTGPPGKSPKYLSVSEQINKQWYVYTMEYYSHRKRNKLFIHLAKGSWTNSNACVVRICVWILPHINKQFLGASRVSKNSTKSTWRWNQIPQVKGSISQDHSPLQMPVEACASDQLATNWRFQRPPPIQDANPKSRLHPVLLNNWL